MRIIITEEQKKKLFIPRKIDGEGSRWSDWNNSQPIIDGRRFNQYDLNGNKIGVWLNEPSSVITNYNKTKSFMENIFDNLKVFDKNGHTIFMIGDDIYFQDPKNNYLWVNYDKIWFILSEQYSLNTTEQVKDLIRIWMEITYKLGSLTPHAGGKSTDGW